MEAMYLSVGRYTQSYRNSLKLNFVYSMRQVLQLVVTVILILMSYNVYGINKIC